MEQLRGLPFKVGDRVELKSFKTGYRGAWFRCEIKGTGKKGVALDLYDYDEDRVIWMKSLHHKVPSRSGGPKKQLMLRPLYPPVHSEGEAVDVNPLSDAVVVTNGAWKVGDLVDWFCDGAYWSGTIITFLEDDKVQLKSPAKPMGEDMVYEALSKDLRPSLEWSQKSGWTVPLPKDKGNDDYCPCARLTKPGPQKQNASASGTTPTPTPVEDSVSQQPRGKQERVNLMNPAQQPERVKVNKPIPLISPSDDSIEASLIGLEELLNRVKWMKSLLQPGSAKGRWKFEEHRAA